MNTRMIGFLLGRILMVEAGLLAALVCVIILIICLIRRRNRR